ncbi:MAG TPA: hypothetical protein C5S50_02450 [Methanosarcinaceae archaeon]|nr:hypothetical protein [Methanosarcinaceae archaeon]
MADELRRLKYTIDPDTVGRILKENDYSLQANRKINCSQRSIAFYLRILIKLFRLYNFPTVPYNQKNRILPP